MGLIMETEFRTKDLYESAYLYSQGQELVRLEKDGHNYWFVFADKEACSRLSNEYWSGKSSAKAYADAIRTLKDRIFAQGR